MKLENADKDKMKKKNDARRHKFEMKAIENYEIAYPVEDEALMKKYNSYIETARKEWEEFYGGESKKKK